MNASKDERGYIEDLKVGDEWSVTYITFKKGAVRGNHYHNQTLQHDFLLSGKLICSSATNGAECESIMKAGDSLTHFPGVAHAYQALEDSEMVSICKGVRVGENYENDTFRLPESEKLL